MTDHREGATELLAVFDRLPTSVKQAGVADLLGYGRSAEDFADPHTQKYPFHTPEATAASLIRLETDPSAIKRAALRGRLLKRAALFGIELPEVKLAEAPPPIDPESDDPLPVNAEEAKAAAAQLLEYGDRLSLAEIRPVASRIVSHFPDAVESETLAQLQKWSFTGAFDRKGVVEALTKRAEIHLTCGRAEEAQAMAELGVEVLGGMPHDKLADAVVLVDAVDRDTGVYGMAGVKTARDLCAHPLCDIERAVEDLVETKTGTLFRRADLATADTVKLAQVFGDAYYQALCDEGLFFSADKAAEAVSNADGNEAALWARVVSPVA